MSDWIVVPVGLVLIILAVAFVRAVGEPLESDQIQGSLTFI